MRSVYAVEDFRWTLIAIFPLAGAVSKTKLEMVIKT